MPNEWKQALKSKTSRRQSEKFDMTPNASDYIDRRQSMPPKYNNQSAPLKHASPMPTSVSQTEPPNVHQQSHYAAALSQQLPHRNIHSPEPADEVFEENLSPVNAAPAEVTTPRRDSLQLTGETSEDAVPESRTEYEDDIQLPSVRNLRSMFNQPDKSEPSDTSVKRVSKH